MRATFAAVALGVLALAGCEPDGADPAIVVTTNILGDVVSEVVGDEASVTVLMPPDADPHMFAISAAQAAELRSAALVVANGLGLEEGLLHHVEAAASDGVPTLEVAPAVLPPGATDPHFWTDPAHVRQAVHVIADRVVEAVPGVDAAAVRRQADRYAAAVDELDRELAAAFAAIPAARRLLVTDHHVFGYLAEAYDLEVVGAVIPSRTTLASPSAADLASLAQVIRERGVPAIFVEATQPARLGRALADEVGVSVEVRALRSESLGPAGSDGGTYLRMMRSNAHQIVAGLTGDAP